MSCVPQIAAESKHPAWLYYSIEMERCFYNLDRRCPPKGAVHAGIVRGTDSESCDQSILAWMPGWRLQAVCGVGVRGGGFFPVAPSLFLSLSASCLRQEGLSLLCWALPQWYSTLTQVHSRGVSSVCTETSDTRSPKSTLPPLNCPCWVFWSQQHKC